MLSKKNQYSLLGASVLLIAIVISSIGIIPASAQSNLITNPGLESGASQTPTGWSESGANVDASKSETGSPHAGTYKATHWKASAYSVNTFQTKTGLTNGTYTLRAWVMSGGGQTTAVMKAENCGGSTQTINIPTSGTWTQIAISNVNVSNGQCTVGFSSVAAANQWFNFEAQFLRAMPEAQFIELDTSHRVFHAFFDMDNLKLPHPTVNVTPVTLSEFTALPEVAIQPLQRQRQQRQRIGPLGGLGQQPLHQRRVDAQPPPGGAGPPRRAGDDLGIPGGGHRLEVGEE